MLITVVWLPCTLLITVVWLPCTLLIAVVWLPCTLLITVVWLPCTLLITVVWLPCTLDNSSLTALYTVDNSSLTALYTVDNSSLTTLYTVDNSSLTALYTVDNSSLTALYTVDNSSLTALYAVGNSSLTALYTVDSSSLTALYTVDNSSLTALYTVACNKYFTSSTSFSSISPLPPLWRCGPTPSVASPFLRFLDHTQRRTTLSRTPLDEWSARRKDLCLKTHITHNRQTSMSPAGFEPTISAGERPQTYALDHVATWTGLLQYRLLYLWHWHTTFSVLLEDAAFCMTPTAL